MIPDSQNPTLELCSHTFFDKRGQPLVISELAQTWHQPLIEMYRRCFPKDSFEGLPPIREDACIRWVEGMIRNGTNLVAVAGQGTIAGHAALFPINAQTCEMLLAVCPQFHNSGIGTELARYTVDLAYRLGFRRIWLCVDAANLKARHMFNKCGFRSLPPADKGDVEMVLDLNEPQEMR